ncbi:hypothetical protein M6B38_300710 [Iris pallida]|uniref:Uncharacterized protein n=1 Tax=Iris pallida TaxID=29817 RepID=A0AAX6HRQ4_IRIPA|nr:hypothetical protein M6B38_300710 [Iris pallida]
MRPGFGFCECLSISCCGLGCQEVSPKGASRRGSSMNASFIQTSLTIPFPFGYLSCGLGVCQFNNSRLISGSNLQH